MKLSRPMRLAAAALTFGTALAIGPMKPASAAANCFYYSPNHWYCNVVEHSPYYDAFSGTRTGGYLPWGWRATLFTCKWDGGAPNGEGWPHPNRWLWQDEAGYSGWINDKDIPDNTNPLPDCNIFQG